MRVLVPTIPHVVSPASTSSVAPAAAIERIASFLASGRVTLLTGAGVSVDSGIRAYRGKDGRYMNPNYKCVPIFITILIPHRVPKGQSLYVETPSCVPGLDSDSIMNWSRTIPRDMHSGMHHLHRHLPHRSHQPRKSRQRYWYAHVLCSILIVTPCCRLRSYLGYPPVRDAQPNTTHYALAAFQHTGHIRHIITQNVDGLHRKAIAHLWDDVRMDEGIIELHGTLHVSPAWHPLGRVLTGIRVYIVNSVMSSAETSSKIGYPPAIPNGRPLSTTSKRLERNPGRIQTVMSVLKLRRYILITKNKVQLEGVSYDDFVVPACLECLAQGRHNTNVC